MKYEISLMAVFVVVAAIRKAKKNQSVFQKISIEIFISVNSSKK
jgi:hypothetical protein